MEDLSQNLSNVHTVTQQPTLAVPSAPTGQQPNGLSALPSISTGRQ